jgi:hypothetical protein
MLSKKLTLPVKVPEVVEVMVAVKVRAVPWVTLGLVVVSVTEVAAGPAD